MGPTADTSWTAETLITHSENDKKKGNEEDQQSHQNLPYALNMYRVNKNGTSIQTAHIF
jgi:hypothetical protein